MVEVHIPHHYISLSVTSQNIVHVAVAQTDFLVLTGLKKQSLWLQFRLGEPPQLSLSCES